MAWEKLKAQFKVILFKQKQYIFQFSHICSIPFFQGIKNIGVNVVLFSQTIFFIVKK